MGARQLVETTRHAWRQHGPRAGLYDMHVRALNRVAGVEILKGMVVTLADVTDATLFEAPGFEGRFTTAEELAPFAADPAYDLPPDFVATAFARGDRCYALFDGPKLAAYGFYARMPTPIDDHFVLRFDPAYTYMYKGYTAPAYRGKRLHAVGMCRALRAFTQEGGKGLVSYVLANNFGSLKSVARMGYRIFGEVYLMRVGGRAFAHATAGCAAYGFGAQPVARPGLPGGSGLQALTREMSLAALRVLAMLALFTDGS
jgi:hypothetical protein